MDGMRELYQQVILDHNKNPRNYGAMENPDSFAHGNNPLCGDTIDVFLRIGNGIVEAVQFEGDDMGMTLGELTRAIQQHIDLDMDAEVAQGMAEHALGFFGFYNRIIDNALEPTDRNLFYMFQDYDLLTTESEETTLWDGREWRIHYWKFKPDLRERVQSYMQRNLREEEIDPFADIYSTDGPSIWTREGEKVTNPNAFTSDW